MVRPVNERARADEGPVAVVTGGAIRVGRAIVRALVADGHRLWVHCHRSIGEAAELAGSLGDACLGVVQADLGDPEERARLAAAILDPEGPGGGRLDLLVNNAASFERGPFDARSDDDLARVLGVNLVAPVSLVRALLPGLRAGGRGLVVNILDLSAYHPWRGYVDHAVAKAGLMMATRALAVELAPLVRVAGIAPGTVLWPDEGRFADEALREKITAAIPLGRVGSPEDVAAAVVFLARSPFLTGIVVPVDGGRLAAGAGE